MSTILNSDIKDLCSKNYIEWDKLRKADFLVTGATGLVGSTVVRTLAYLNKDEMFTGNIYVLVRNSEKVKSVFGNDFEKYGIIPIKGDVREPISVSGNIDYIIHGASVTASKEMVTYPAETLMTAVAGTENMLRLAVEKKIKGMVYLSSMEVYGITSPEQNPVTEEKLGFVDLSSVRSCYPEGKRTCECLCGCYAKEYDVPVRIARLAQTFGAGVSSSETRVFASFAKTALKNEDIILHTKGNSTGNYCYTADVAGALLCLLTKGAKGEAYNVVNENNTMKIREMAELVAGELSDGSSKLVFDIPEDSLKFGYAPDTSLRLSGEKLRSLGWKSEVDMPEMYRRMVAYWNE